MMLVIVLENVFIQTEDNGTYIKVSDKVVLALPMCSFEQSHVPSN